MTEPYRSPLGWNKPTLTQQNPEIEVQVSIPNEDPDTEDDLTINVKFTGEGIIIDLLVSDGEPVATFGQTYEEFANTVVDLDPMTVPPRPLIDSPIQKVAALSADLRSIIEANDADEYGDSEAEAACARDLLDAIDALLSEAGR